MTLTLSVEGQRLLDAGLRDLERLTWLERKASTPPMGLRVVHEHQNWFSCVFGSGNEDLIHCGVALRKLVADVDGVLSEVQTVLLATVEHGASLRALSQESGVVSMTITYRLWVEILAVFTTLCRTYRHSPEEAARWIQTHFPRAVGFAPHNRLTHDPTRAGIIRLIRDR